MKKLLFLLGVITIVLVLFLGAVSAATPEKKVTNVNSVQYEQSSDGTKVVWVDTRSGVNNIYSRDLASPQPEIAIDAKSSDQYDPDISGNIVVWRDFRTGTPQIYYKDIKSAGEAIRVNPSIHTQVNPKISGKKIIWMEWIGDKRVLRGYNIETDEPITLPASVNNQELQDIEGNNVIFIENHVLYLYNLISANITPISSKVYEAEISGNNIVYDTNVHVGDYKKLIKNYNISTMATTIVSNNTEINAGMPSIYGLIAVWMEGTGGKYDIMMKNISKTNNPIITVCNNQYHQSTPTISGISKIGYFITWQDLRNGTKLYYRNMETISPIILYSIPKNNQWGVNRFSSITIKFNKFINPGANYSKIRVKNMTTSQNIAITKYMKFDTLVIKTAAKKPSTFYQVILPSKSIISVANNNLSTTKTIKFRTRA